MNIPHSQPYFDQTDGDILTETLKGRFVSYGKKAENFGRDVASILGKKWGIPTQSGTDALTAALKLLKLKPQTQVLVPAYICSAPLDSLAHNELIPKPVDIDRNTLAIDMDMVNTNKKIKNVIAAHLFGIPAPLHKIEGKNLIEDCAQTLKVANQGKTVGSSGLLSICSFYATKLLTTGHGGLIAGNDKALLANAYDLFIHDKQDTWGPHWHFLMSDLNAALGSSQLKKLDHLIEERRRIASIYVSALTGSDKITPGCYSRFLIIPDGIKFGVLLDKFTESGIDAKKPVYKPLYQYLGLNDKDYPNAKWVHDNIISVPIYPGMKEEEICKIEHFLKEHKNVVRCWPPA